MKQDKTSKNKKGVPADSSNTKAFHDGPLTSGAKGQTRSQKDPGGDTIEMKVIRPEGPEPVFGGAAAGLQDKKNQKKLEKERKQDIRQEKKEQKKAAKAKKKKRLQQHWQSWSWANMSLRQAAIAMAAVSLAATSLIYMFSDETKIQALSCSGNYYYSASQIYEKARLSDSMRTWNQPGFQIESRLKADPLIQSAKVSRNGRSLKIDVQEKTILGYFVQEGQNYLLASDGSIFPIENINGMKNLIHFPLLADLSEEMMQAIAKEFREYPDYLTRDVLEKIAEILPWSESYDENMIKMVMQDGNVVFTSIPSLHMIANYQLMLTELQGEDVCLVLDGENQAIDKIACSYMYMTSKERDEYRQELRRQLEEAKKAAEEEARRQKEEQEKAEAEGENTDPAQEEQPVEAAAEEVPAEVPAEEVPAEPAPEEQPAPEVPVEEVPVEEVPPVEEQPVQSQRVEADDWQDCGWSWLVYSPSTNVYQDRTTGLQYTWDENTLSFNQLD